jgi:hypothetical protein
VKRCTGSECFFRCTHWRVDRPLASFYLGQPAAACSSYYVKLQQPAGKRATSGRAPRAGQAGSRCMARIPPVFYWTIRFTRDLSWARWLQSTLSHPVSLRFILILFYRLCLGPSSGPIPSGIPIKMFVRIFHLSHAFYMFQPSHPPSLQHLNNIWWSIKTVKLSNNCLPPMGQLANCWINRKTFYK